MVDALTPAVESLLKAASNGDALDDALIESAKAAEAGMKATIPMVARKGRASLFGRTQCGPPGPGCNLILSSVRNC